MIVFISKCINSSNYYNINKKRVYSQVIGRKCLGESKTILPKTFIKYKLDVKKLNSSSIKLNKWDTDKKIKFPERLIPQLAEEIGISIGDGFLSNKKYEYRLKGDKREKKYYDSFIKQLYKRLYNLEINLKEYESTYGFEIYSQALWKFKESIIGIEPGRKNNIKIPKIIQVNNQAILTSFLRGIFDTDGSVTFIKKYGYGNYYPMISLTLKSKNAIDTISEMLSMLGFDPKMCYDKRYSCWQLYMNGYERLERYSKIIGWNNPKHINKVKKWKELYPQLGKNVNTNMVAVV